MPPPRAVTTPKSRMPKMSSCFLTARMAPDKAKATVPSSSVVVKRKFKGITPFQPETVPILAQKKDKYKVARWGSF